MRKIGVLEDGVKRAPGSRGIISGLIAAIGSAWASRKTRRTVEREVRFVSWAGRATTDSWFMLQLEQEKNNALYYARSRIR